MFQIDHKTPKRWALLAFSLLCLNAAVAQKAILSSKEQPVEPITPSLDQSNPPDCGSTDMMDKLFREHPDMFYRQQQIDQLTRERIYGGDSFNGNTEPIGASSSRSYRT